MSNQTRSNLVYHFITAFQDLLQHQLNNNSEQPHLIIQTCLPNTFILHIPPTITFLTDPHHPPYHTTLTNNNAPSSRKKSIILEEFDSQNYQQDNLPIQLIDQFQPVPEFPQLSAQQLECMTPSQLAFMLDRISSDQLDEQQRESLMRIKQSLVGSSPFKRQSDTKNIPKNFTKAMFTYAMSNVELLNKLLHKLMLTSKRDQFIEWLRENKRAIHNIKQLKCLNGSDHEFVRPFKLIQNHFLKHNAPCYIFNSRIENTPAHLKAKQHITKQLFHEQNDK